MNKLQAAIMLTMVCGKPYNSEDTEGAKAEVEAMEATGLVAEHTSPLFDVLLKDVLMIVTEAGIDALQEYVAMLEARVDKLGAPTTINVGKVELIDTAIELLRMDDDKPSRGYWQLKAGPHLYDRLRMADSMEHAFSEELSQIERIPKQPEMYLKWPRKSSNERIVELETSLAHHRSRNDELDGVVARQSALLLEKDHRIVALTQEVTLCKENALVLAATPTIRSDTPLNDATAKWFTDSILAGIEMAKCGEQLAGAPETVGATIIGMARDAYIANHTKMPEPIGPDTPADARNVGWFQVEVNNGYNDACAAFDNGQPRPTKTGIGTVGAYLYNVGVNSGWNKKRLDKLQGVFSDFNHAAQHV